VDRRSAHGGDEHAGPGHRRRGLHRLDDGAALLDAGHEVVVADDLSAGHRDAVPDAAAFVEVDVTDPAAIDAVVADGGSTPACTSRR
jgi:hypothetical protein